MIEGWLTDGQAERLADGRGAVAARRRGRRDRVLPRQVARSCWPRAAGSLIAIDPHAGSDRGPQEIAADEARGDADFDAFHANLAAAGVADRVRHVRKFSADAHQDVTGPLSLLYVDGAHRFGPARADLRDWGRRVAPGGVMLVHDSFSSIGVTLALLVECALSPRWRYVGRTGSLAEYERVEAGGRETAGALRRASCPGSPATC